MKLLIVESSPRVADEYWERVPSEHDLLICDNVTEAARALGEGTYDALIVQAMSQSEVNPVSAVVNTRNLLRDFRAQLPAKVMVVSDMHPDLLEGLPEQIEFRSKNSILQHPDTLNTWLLAG